MTPQQSRLFAFLSLRVDQLVQPSVGDMADHMGIGRASVHRLLQQLLAAGRVEKLDQAERCWRAVPINPLERFSEDELLGELERRGWQSLSAPTDQLKGRSIAKVMP